MTNKRWAVYAGSFDPVTLGHRSVVERAAGMFERVFCLVAVHPTKQALFTPEERVHLMREILGDLGKVTTDHDDGFTVNFARRCGAGVLVRGIRDASDAGYETELAQLNRDIAPEIETVFVPADRTLASVSSSALRRLAAEGKDLDHLCHPAVARALRERLAARVADAADGGERRRSTWDDGPQADRRSIVVVNEGKR